jgi:hypothetical protein
MIKLPTNALQGETLIALGYVRLGLVHIIISFNCNGCMMQGMIEHHILYFEHD